MEERPPPYSEPPAYVPLYPGSQYTFPQYLGQPVARPIRSRIAKFPRPRENLILSLKAYETVYVVDDAASMGYVDEQSGIVPWTAARDALTVFATICEEWEQDGQDLWFLNSHIPIRNARPRDIEHAFNSISPFGKTDMASAIRRVVCGYFQRYTPHTKPLNIVAITDGVLSDDIISAIRWINRELDKRHSLVDQICIEVIQIGTNNKPGRSLRSLGVDFSQVGLTHDLIDTVSWESKREPFSDMYIVKAVSKVLMRRWDDQMGRGPCNRLRRSRLNVLVSGL